MTAKEYDYIVIGAGSAGSVIAARILQQRGGSVLLLEAGGSDKHPFVKMPAGVAKIIAKKTWPYMTEPQPETCNRPMTVAQGKILGGSSSVNGMIYIRGQRQDYDAWANEFGCHGWGYDDLLPYFKRAEANESLSGEFHGRDGLLPVSENRYRHPLSMAFLRAGQELGLSYVTDFNATEQQGVGFFQTTTWNGERASTSKTYLKDVQNNTAFKLELKAFVENISIVDGRARGVNYRGKDGRQCFAKASREVILSAGAIGSPKLLQLSGIGACTEMTRNGITSVLDLPAVGQNFKDHLHLSINAQTNLSNSLYGADRGVQSLRNLLQWLAFRSGPVSSNILECGAFVDSCGQGHADVQIHFLSILDTWDDPDGIGKGRTHGITLKTGHLKPRSSGTVKLRSSDPYATPRIEANFLKHPEDMVAQIRAVRLAIDFMSTQALQTVADTPFSPALPVLRDTAALEHFIRSTCKTTYHPVGTCRMGPDAANSVVNLKLQVHGIEGLRVADSSIFPDLISGNTNAAVIAIAEKAADLILDNSLVPKL